MHSIFFYVHYGGECGVKPVRIKRKYSDLINHYVSGARTETESKRGSSDFRGLFIVPRITNDCPSK